MYSEVFAFVNLSVRQTVRYLVVHCKLAVTHDHLKPVTADYTYRLQYRGLPPEARCGMIRSRESRTVHGGADRNQTSTSQSSPTETVL